MQVRYAVVFAALSLGSATHPATAADSFFSLFEADPGFEAPRAAAPRQSGAGAAPSGPQIGPWTTTVSRDSETVTGWTAASTPSATTKITTGTIGREDRMRTLPGPRLTGTGHALSGVASYYWQDQMTATGERFNKRDMTAAHKTLPFGTRVRVTRVDTGANVIVRINDRGPFKPGRIIDLSERAAQNLNMTGIGTTPVRLEVLGQ